MAEAELPTRGRVRSFLVPRGGSVPGLGREASLLRTPSSPLWVCVCTPPLPQLRKLSYLHIRPEKAEANLPGITELSREIQWNPSFLLHQDARRIPGEGSTHVCLEEGGLCRNLTTQHVTCIFPQKGAQGYTCISTSVSY